MHSSAIHHVISVVCFSILLATSPETAASEDRSVLLLLMLGTPETRAVEVALQDELALLLDDHTLVTLDPFVFATDSLAGRLEMLRPLAREQGADAVAWLEAVNSETFVFQIVVIGPGRSTVRSVEAARTGDPAGQLAIAARGLLEEIYLRPSPVKPPAKPDSPPASTKSKPEPVHLFVGPFLSGGFADPDQSPLMPGGKLGVGLDLPRGFMLDIHLGFFWAPAHTVPDGDFSTFGFFPSIGVAMLPGRRTVTAGPRFTIELPWQRAIASINEEPSSRDSWWNLRMALALDLQIRLGDAVRISICPGLTVQIRREVFQRLSDQKTIYVSPYLGWNLSTGIIFNFN